jgi:hypothetical protein
VGLKPPVRDGVEVTEGVIEVEADWLLLWDRDKVGLTLMVLQPVLEPVPVTEPLCVCEMVLVTLTVLQADPDLEDVVQTVLVTLMDRDADPERESEGDVEGVLDTIGLAVPDRDTEIEPEMLGDSKDDAETEDNLDEVTVPDLDLDRVTVRVVEKVCEEVPDMEGDLVCDTETDEVTDINPLALALTLEVAVICPVGSVAVGDDDRVSA